MLEAKSLGYQLPIGFLDKWVSYQNKRANNWTSNSRKHYYYRSEQLIQAYRLYTLALAGKPALGAMNRMREMSNLTAYRDGVWQQPISWPDAKVLLKRLSRN